MKQSEVIRAQTRDLAINESTTYGVLVKYSVERNLWVAFCEKLNITEQAASYEDLKVKVHIAVSKKTENTKGKSYLSFQQVEPLMETMALSSVIVSARCAMAGHAVPIVGDISGAVFSVTGRLMSLTSQVSGALSSIRPNAPRASHRTQNDAIEAARHMLSSNKYPLAMVCSTSEDFADQLPKNEAPVINKERMEKAISAQRFTMPEGLTREEMREHIKAAARK